MELFLSLDGAVLGAGAELLTILGRDQATAAGLTLGDLIVDAEPVHCLLAVALRGGDSDTVTGEPAFGGYTPEAAAMQGAAGSRVHEVALRCADGSTFPHPAYVRVCPLYGSNDGRVERLLLTLEIVEHADATSTSSSKAHDSSEVMAIEAMEASSMVVEADGPTGGTVEGVRNTSAQAERLLRGMPCSGIDNSSATQRFAWSALYSAVLQKDMFSNVFVTQPAGRARDQRSGVAPADDDDDMTSGAEADSKSGAPYQIWHVSEGLERLLGFPEDRLMGKDVNLFRAKGQAPPPLLDQVGELDAAIRHRHNKLLETVLSSASGAPVFCLVYVLPLHHRAGPRVGSVAVAVLNVHSSLPLLQRHVDQHAGMNECDLYTFLRLSLLNLLVTDPSAAPANPRLRNPIVFASSGFGAMCGCAPHEVLHVNCRFLQSSAFLDVPADAHGRVADSAVAEAEQATQLAAQAHMSHALDAQQESLTYVQNFRKDGTRFGNLLFMAPIRARRTTGGASGVLFWIGVQHPVIGSAAQRGNQPMGLVEKEYVDFDTTLRTTRQALQALQLQELYGAFAASAVVTAISVAPADGLALQTPTSICRLCEQKVVASDLQAHTHYCNIIMQCKALATSCDETLARIAVRLNAVANTSHIFGSSANQASMLLEALRGYTLVLASITAGSHALPLLSSLPPKIDELVLASRVPPSTAAVWADIKAAGARKLAALQHGMQWAMELQCTIVQQPASDPLAIGQAPTLADFEMIREIQRGSHAAVWLVRKKQTNDEFAMKVIDKNRGRMHRLITERKVLFSCQSNFVVTVFFAFEDAERLHLVMECLASDAKHLLQRRGVLEERQVISLMADTCLGLEHLHACGIIHRDLKPENMLLTCEGRVKLADFGLSQLLQRGALTATDEQEIARDPSIVGTPFYMAPEVIRGKARGYEAAADWWSYGAITYELLTGFTPFQGTKVAEIYRAILSLAFACPPARCAISPEAADLITRTLAPNPRQRLAGAPTIMTHPFFAGVDWASHADTGGSRESRLAQAQNQPTMQALAAMGRALHGHRGSATAPALPSSPGFRMAEANGSAASGASTHLELGSVLSSLNPEDHDAHLDNLTALNDKVSFSQLRQPQQPAPSLH